MLGFNKDIDKKYDGFEQKIDRAICNTQYNQAANIFVSGMFDMQKAKRFDLLSKLIDNYYVKLSSNLKPNELISYKKAADLSTALDKEGYPDKAAVLLGTYGLSKDLIELLSKSGMGEQLVRYITKENPLTRERLTETIQIWESHNGNFSNSPALLSMVKAIGRSSHDILPNRADIKRTAGYYGEAAVLYETASDFNEAAICYEQTENIVKAYENYKKSNNREGISRTAEKLGNLEEALEYVENPARKIILLLKLKRFIEANNYALSFADYDKYADTIQDATKDHINNLIALRKYEEALKLIPVISNGDDLRKSILDTARSFYEGELQSAQSNEDMMNAYRNIVKVEELAGNYEKAGKIAEDILKDYDKASFLYEKANLFNKAINTADSSESDSMEVRKRLANLHERGGNIVSAAKLYEEINDFEKASKLYELLGNYQAAASCYSKISAPDIERLASLYQKSGECEKAVMLYIANGSIERLEKAKAIAHANNLFTHENVIDGMLAEMLSGSEEDVLSCLKEAEKRIIDTYSDYMGIDFGTTNSVGALYNKKTKSTEIVPLPGTTENYYEPSYFGVDDSNRPIFGYRARNQSQINPDKVITRIKRQMGLSKFFNIGAKRYKAEEISAFIINHIKENAEEYLRTKKKEMFLSILSERGIKFQSAKLDELFNENVKDTSITDVVLTVPAFYNDNQKRATRDAAEVAGLNILRLMHEPTAAAFAYGHNRTFDGKIAVIDLGGGTLDISLVEVGDGVYEVIDVNGDIKLGGSDIDEALVNYVCGNIKRTLGVDLTEAGDKQAYNRLREACENLKINLSQVNSYSIELHHFLGQDKYVLTMTRPELEQIANPILTRFRDVLSKTQKNWQKHHEEPNNILLVGNATKMPAIERIVTETLGSNLLRGTNPGTIVAAGAALLSAKLKGDLGDAVLLDIVPYSLGIAVQKQNTQTGMREFSKLIDRTTTIPIRKTDTYTTTHDNQTEVTIEVYQGESQNLSQDYFLGKFTLTGIKPEKQGEAKIAVTFDIGTDCILNVTARDEKTGQAQSIRIDGAVTLSPTEKAGLKQFFAKSKVINSTGISIDHDAEEIDKLLKTFETIVENIKSEHREFLGLFEEKIQKNAKMYKATGDDAMSVQDMFMKKDYVLLDLQRYVDQITSAKKSFEQYAKQSIDYSSEKAMDILCEKHDGLQNVRRQINATITESRENTLQMLISWNNVLKGMQADYSKLDPENAAYSLMATGKYEDAKKVLEGMISSVSGLSERAFGLLLSCYTRLCMREEYKGAHEKYGYIFGYKYPDFNRLDAYLNRVSSSIVMIAVNNGDKSCTGSGFAIKKNLIITNRHVVEGSTPDMIAIIGREKISRVLAVKIDPANDIAALTVEADFEPMRVGEFNFVHPGEQVIAIGFPSPSSNSFSDNIYISKGIVNSIRKLDEQSERVIYIDAKIGGGMSGGPLINDLGEVIGINSMVRYKMADSEHGAVALENQNIALSAHLIRQFM